MTFVLDNVPSTADNDTGRIPYIGSRLPRTGYIDTLLDEFDSKSNRLES